MAQTSAPPATAALGYHFSAWQWMPTAVGALRGSVCAAAVLVCGLIVALALRRYIRRTRLAAAIGTAIFTAALYVGVAASVPDRLLDHTDYATLWLNRLCAAALLFAGLRLIDRLLIVPLLARGHWRGERAPSSRIIHQIVNTAVVAIAVMSFGAIAFNWDIDKFLAGSAVVSIVIGLALQETLGNFFSGLVMHASSPFAVGDWVGLADLEGRVVDMSWRAVTIRTPNDDDVIVPNGAVARDKIVNFHSPSPASARSVEVGLDYEIPPGQATAVLKAAALEAEGVLPDPAPSIYLQQFGDSSIVYRIKFWIDNPASHSSIEHRVRSNVWYRLRQHGFAIPFPIRVLEHSRAERKHEHRAKAAIEHRCKAIADVVLFQPLSPEQIRTIASGAADVLLGPGQVLFHQGEAGDSLFIIRRGEVEVLAGHDGNARHRIATLRRGDFFGEMSALTGQPRSATIRALTDLCCVEICKSDLGAMFAADPSIMEKMSQIVVDRSVARSAALSDAAAATPAQKISQQSSMLQRMRSFFGRGRE